MPESPTPRPRPTAIIALETAIAKVHWTPEQSRDIEQDLQPDGPWPSSAPSRRSCNGTARWPSRAWQRRQSWSSADERGPGRSASCSTACRSRPGRTISPTISSATTRIYLPQAFDQANFDFFSKTLRDVPTQRDRWKRGVPGQRRAGRGGRPDLRPAPLSAGKRPADGRADRQHPRGATGEDRDQQLDGRADQARRRWPSWRPSIRASATRPNISTIRPSRSIATTCSATPAGRTSSTGTCCCPG